VTSRRKSSAAKSATMVARAGSVMPPSQNAVVQPTPLDASYKIRRVGSRFAIELVLDGTWSIIPRCGPRHGADDWHATMSIELATGDAKLAITPFESMATPIDLDATSSHVEFQIDNCDGRVHARLHVIAKEPGSKKVTLYVTPTLGVAHCDR